jgi:hypothetical protein
MTAEDARRLANALSENSRIMAQHAATLKATLPQSFTLEELEARYGGMGRVDLKHLLKACYVWPAYTVSGQTIRIPLDHVLLVDDVVNKRIDPALLKPNKVA